MTSAGSDARRPKVSVCLLAYNHEALLEETVHSLLAQELTDFELLLSDDQSTDGTWGVIQRLAAGDTRVRPIRTPKNLGMPGNANFAASHARGEYIALLHHDDLYSPDLLSRWVALAERHPSVGFVSCAYATFGDARVDYHPFQECHPGRDALENILFPRWGCPVRGTALIRASCWQAVGGIRPQFGLLSDVDLWMRLAARYDVGYVRAPLITVRQDRPKDYPAEYTGWTWSRLRLMFEIHGANRLEYFGGDTPRGRAEMRRFRQRVSAHEAYWLLYAVAKRRWHMLRNSEGVANGYETSTVVALRRSLQRLATIALP